jgi:hypothetical protein
MDSTIARSVNDNINMDSTIAKSVNDNINMDSIIARSVNAGIYTSYDMSAAAYLIDLN